MAFKDYYQILGVARDATDKDIKRAYHRLARKFHPDVSKETDAESRFKEVKEAYDVLHDVQKRAAYDQYGADWQNAQQAESQGFHHYQYQGNSAGEQPFDFDDVFQSMFGGRAHTQGGRQRSRAHFDFPGEDLRARIQIDLEDSYRGTTRSITLGSDSGGQARTLNVRIPRGVLPGQHIRLAGQGNPGMGSGANGDLLLEVSFRPHPLYRVEGRDVYLTLPVAPWEAALGATVTVPLPEGSIDLKIPANSANGRRLRLKGKGIPGKDSGDFYVELSVVLPAANSAAAKQAYHTFQETLDFDPRANWGGRA
ncbi:DnaJ C-terminal domain-containing protein [Shewanella dokdonensis]|uniref:DnaJ domain-containing protein n=1 Tax=Shewanella dokdonensis TaxID=712036 RepID=A0ABX8DD19_9GAMM|nr:DnaJ C-terminal domain-containing protein [Shewanella dokdonensis]MCL1074711.1 DnaJ domain-containing protein [Shewanella dokdonensis]QVK22310.1 DnaJ domain-containing protein [Shewanella dokdonensis]